MSDRIWPELPVIGSDGTVYLSAPSQYFFAFDSTGKVKWKYKTQGYPTAPAIDRNGNIYFLTDDFSNAIYFGSLYALTSSGKLKWKFNYKSHSTNFGYLFSPTIDKWSNIYFAYDALYAIHPRGTLKWKIGGGFWNSPVIYSNGTIYITRYNKLFALR